MANRFVDVVITRETKPITEQGFGLPLILSTDGAHPYTVYREFEDFAADFAAETETYKLGQRMFGQNPRPSEIAVVGVVEGAAETFVTALTDLQATNNDWYYLVSTANDEATVTALADYVSTQDKLYGATVQDPAFAATLSGQYDNAFLVVHDQEDAYVAEGLIATVAPRVIGSYTWTFKNVQGVPAASFDNTKINEIHDNNASTYINEAGILMNSHGVATSGEYLDVIQATHFLKARLAEYVFRLLALKDKVPYTDAGIALVVAEVENVLDRAFQQGIIADEEGEPLYTISYPTRAEIPANDRARRVLPDIEWTAVVAGAVEKVEIRGVLTI